MKNRFYFIFVIIIFNTLGRMIPHPPNMTPMVSMSLYTGQQLSRRDSLIVLISSMLCSDLLLHFMFNYPIFGSWTFFSYSALAAIVWFGRKLTQGLSDKLLFYIIGSSLFFWLWTNFGVFLFSNLYPYTLIGIFNCYVAALPFLKNQLLGDIGWAIIIFGGSYLILYLKNPPFQRERL